MEWKSTKEKPIVFKPMENLKKLVDNLPGKIQKSREEIRKLKNDSI